MTDGGGLLPGRPSTGGTSDAQRNSGALHENVLTLPGYWYNIQSFIRQKRYFN